MKLLEILKKIPAKPGIYFFKDQEREVLYVGKARNLRQRVTSYFLPSVVLGSKTKDLATQVESIDYQIVESEFDALLLEAEVIKKFQPKYNFRLKDDKSFLYIKITEEIFPRVYPARKESGGFGPLPQARIVRGVLRQIRLIFPFRSCRTLPKKACLYFDLGLCPAPCLGKISPRGYRRQIKAIKALLEGKSQKLIKILNSQMRQKAQEASFEEAAKLRDQIAKIEWLIKSRPTTTDYLENPNLVEDLRTAEAKDLYIKLKTELPNFSFPPERIEAYDVSSIGGKKATGSLVVFDSGEADKGSYRRFRIKFSSKPNDVAMIKEMLVRRLTHDEWEKPDLVLVDGGKGQVSAVLEALNQAHSKIPVIGLAKRLEEVIFKSKKGEWKVEKFSPPSPALNLLKRVRDEAHRFALTYHRHLRESLTLG